jgi:hypothetical protein
MAHSIYYFLERIPENFNLQLVIFSAYYGYSDDALRTEPPQELEKNKPDVNHTDIQSYFTERGVYL